VNSGFLGAGLLGPSGIKTSRGIATPIPTLGAELLTNGNFDAGDTGWTHGAAWSIGSGVATGIATNFNGIAQGSLTTNVWYISQIDVVTRTAGYVYMQYGASANTVQHSTTGTKYQVGRGDAGAFRIVGADAFGGTVDNASCKAITLASVFAGRAQASADMDISAPVTLFERGLRAGVTARLDSLTSPANFLMASHDGAYARLTQCKAGAYTELIVTSLTYVAGAAVRIWVSGNTAKLYYNGAQVGANQTIDAALTGTIFGKFNTHASNVLGACTIVPAA